MSVNSEYQVLGKPGGEPDWLKAKRNRNKVELNCSPLAQQKEPECQSWNNWLFSHPLSMSSSPSVRKKIPIIHLILKRGPCLPRPPPCPANKTQSSWRQWSVPHGTATLSLAIGHLPVYILVFTVVFLVPHVAHHSCAKLWLVVRRLCTCRFQCRCVGTCVSVSLLAWVCVCASLSVCVCVYMCV